MSANGVENGESTEMSVTSLDETAVDADPSAIVHESGPRTVFLSLDADEMIPGHRHPESTVLFHVLSGTVTLTVGDETRELTEGDVARFDGTREVSPRATTSANALVILVET